MNSGLRAPPWRGDKTYKSWAAVGVLLEEDLRYLWLVEHLGLKGPLSVTWDEVLSEDGGKNGSLLPEEQAPGKRLGSS
ncbi:unnamed protein product [Rangifer tarandus platyrhynchus]|uniref:Uncharacterized protein n=1 Tax=Rangifer tarandus platyrhynchus TaxID=3082113 RepID=A0AC59ZEI2_RANTA